MKLYQSSRLYVKIDEKFRWLITPEIAEKVVGVDWEKQVREYVDDQDIFNNLGKSISEWPEKDPPVTPRMWAIAGTCMNRPDWYDALGEMKFTHVYFNRACWMDLDRLAGMGIKAFINYTGEDEEHWKVVYNQWKDHPACGGHWLDDSGHEPDISRRNERFSNWPHRLEVRKKFRKCIKALNPNAVVMEMMDNTATDDFPNVHPGWKLAHSEETYNLLLVDIYPDSPNAGLMIAAMERSWNKFIRVYPHQHQVIIQMCAYGKSYWPGYIRTQYDFWKEKMASMEFDNPYRGRIGICYYKQETMMHSEEMQREIQEVNEEVLRK